MASKFGIAGKPSANPFSRAFLLSFRRPITPADSRVPMSRPWLAPALLLLLPTLAVGAKTEKERPFIDESRPERDGILEPEYWKERGFELPPYPQDSDLIELRLDAPTARFNYFIDGANLQIGTDQVVRYTLVVRSKTGAENVAVEGVRCDTPQYKVYAYGTRGGFKTVARGDWKRIGPGEADQAQRELQRYYLCQPGHYKPRPPSEMRSALRGQVHLHDSGFIPD